MSTKREGDGPRARPDGPKLAYELWRPWQRDAMKLTSYIASEWRVIVGRADELELLLRRGPFAGQWAWLWIDPASRAVREYTTNAKARARIKAIIEDHVPRLQFVRLERNATEEHELDPMIDEESSAPSRPR